jgi:hypothetical protein
MSTGSRIKMDAQSVKLRKFNMKDVQQDSVVIFIGKRRTGKSTLVRDLLWHHRDLPMGTVISGTEESNSFYGSIIPPMFIHGEYSPAVISNFVKRQQLITKKIRETTGVGVTQAGAVTQRGGLDPRSFLIMDDCLYNNTWASDQNIRYLFLNGRHQKVFFIITMQYPLGIPPVLRTNVDYVFILRENFHSNRKRIFDNYGAAFPSFDFFCQIMDQCTENYECLVINNTTRSNKLEDMIFWYKADMHPEFRIGAPQFWQHNAVNYRDKDEEDVNLYHGEDRRARNAPMIQVRKMNY